MVTGHEARATLAYDVVCVGGGVIGLLSAFELAQRRLTVAITDQGPIGREASWAGAGILLPASLDAARDDKQRIHGYTIAQFPALADQLRALTGIDVGYRRTGAIELLLTAESTGAKAPARPRRRKRSITYEVLASNKLQELEPRIAELGVSGRLLPDAAQVRNPRLLQAVARACQITGVNVLPERPVVGFERSGDRLTAIQMADGQRLPCGAAVVTAGAWSAPLLERAGCHIPVFPVQGQIVAIQTDGSIVRHIILVGKRYLVPRDDGLVLVGSTEDDVGFDKHNTTEGVEGLKVFAYDLFPTLRENEITSTWAGLRPGCRLKRPIIGKVPGWENLWVATGHFRQGIQMSLGTARVLSDAMVGAPTFVNLDSFSVAG